MNDLNFKNILHTEMFTAKTAVKSFKFSFHWTINDFSLIAKKKNEFLSSKIFSTVTDSTEILNWKLILYPNLEKVEYFNSLRKNQEIEYISIKLVLTSGKLDETVKFAISLVDKNNEKKCIKSYIKMFVSGEENSNDEYFVKRNDLFGPESGYLSNDALTILCEGVWCSTVDSEVLKNSFSSKLQKNFGNDFEVFLENEKLCDVTITLPDGEIKAHKLILAARSPVFKAMFLNETNERETGRVDITDVTLKIFREMLTFIYTGKSPNISLIAMDLLKAADKYALLELKEMCADSICSNLSVENSIEVLKLANLYGLGHLKTITLDFMRNHVEEVFRTVFQS